MTMQDISRFTNVFVQHDARSVATVTLNRPEKRNAFDAALIANLQSVFDSLASNDSTRAVVLTGAQDAFCAGMDLDHMRTQGTLPHADNVRDALALATLLETIKQFPKPVIAKVNGSAFGGGLGLIAAADIAIGVYTAQFAFTEVRLGLVPAVIAPYVVAAIGERHARRWFLSGATFTAGAACDMGLLHTCALSVDLNHAIDTEVTHLLKGGPKALATAKKLIRDISGENAALASLTTALLADLRASAEGQEGLSAFNERRPPSWCVPKT
jgi:methylglutaconyl-CoA hydratase